MRALIGFCAVAQSSLAQGYLIDTIYTTSDSQVSALAVDSGGDIFIASAGDFWRIRRISPSGVVTTVAGGDTSSADGVPATSAILPGVSALAVDAAGKNIFVASRLSAGTPLEARRIDPSGTIHMISGLPQFQCPVSSPDYCGPGGMAVDSNGNLFLAIPSLSIVIRVSPSGEVRTVVGGGNLDGDGVPATLVRLVTPLAVAIDADGISLLVTEFKPPVSRIRRVGTDGVISTVVPEGGVHLTSDGLGILYLTEPLSESYGSLVGAIRAVFPNGTIQTIAGGGSSTQDGVFGTDARLVMTGPPFYVNSLAASWQSRDGTVLLLDGSTRSWRVRRLTPAPSCTYVLSPPSNLNIPAAGSGVSPLTLSVMTSDQRCPWTATVDQPWIGITSGSPGTGNGVVDYVVVANTGTKARSGNIVIADQKFPITQQGTSQTTPVPTIETVVSAASHANGPISPGEIVTISGTAIGPAIPAYLSLDQNGSVATVLGGVQVLFDGVPVPLTYVSTTQINAAVPYELAAAPNPSAQVKFQGHTSDPYLLKSATTAPALFTLNASGSGPGAILNQDNSVNSPSNPAARGSYIVLYLTGEGQTAPPGVTGAITTLSPVPPLTPQPLLPVAVNIGGEAAAIAFYGEAPGLISGVLQINTQVPNTIPPGSVPVHVSVGGNSSQNGVTVSVK